MKFSESFVDDATLVWLEALGCAVLHGAYFATGNSRRIRPVPSTLIQTMAMWRWGGSRARSADTTISASSSTG